MEEGGWHERKEDRHKGEGMRGTVWTGVVVDGKIGGRHRSCLFILLSFTVR